MVSCKRKREQFNGVSRLPCSSSLPYSPSSPSSFSKSPRDSWPKSTEGRRVSQLSPFAYFQTIPFFPGGSQPESRLERQRVVTHLIAASANLSYLRGLPADHPYVHNELLSIMQQVEFEQAQTQSLQRFAAVKRTFGRSNARRLVTGVLVMGEFAKCQ